MANTTLALANILIMLLSVVKWGLIVWAISSWLVAFNIVNTRNRVVSAILDALDRVYEPLVRPVRRIMPDFGGIDLSPLVLLLVLEGSMMLIDGAARDFLALPQ
jgi:YggT family protein